jgi:hypothetical protein
MKTTLNREDIVNHTIKNIWVTPWISDGPTTHNNDPFYFRQAYIELDNSYIFDIQGQYPFEELPIISVDIKTIEVSQSDGHLLAECIGQKIVEVLTSNLMPTFCLLLENKKLLYCSVCGLDAFGPLASELGYEYKIDDFATYWGHTPLNLVLK